ncbi:MAG: HK97 family phage prohead protease [Pseudomonadota bacterium]
MSATQATAPEHDVADPITFAARISGYASLFGVPDENGDIVERNAFSASLRRPRPVRMLFQHKPERPIGVWRTIKEDARGLFVSGDLIVNCDDARNLYALLCAGAIDGLSIGFRTIKSRSIAGGRRISVAELWEISLVSFPMAPKARILDIGPVRPLKTFAAAARRDAPDGAILSSALREAATRLTAAAQ